HRAGIGAPSRVDGRSEGNEPAAVMSIRAHSQLGIWNSEFGIRSAIPNSKFSIPNCATRSKGRMGRIGALIALGLCITTLPTSTGAQHAPAGDVTLTATSANVREAGSPVKIHILRWSTDEERTPVIAALKP